MNQDNKQQSNINYVTIKKNLFIMSKTFPVVIPEKKNE